MVCSNFAEFKAAPIILLYLKDYGSLFIILQIWLLTEVSLTVKNDQKLFKAHDKIKNL